MHVRPATREDLEFIRQTRNAGRRHFTVDTSEISETDQRQWWESARRSVLIFEFEDGEPLGYAYVTRRAGHLWISLAVAPQHQGMGWGTEIYRHTRGDTPIRAEIRPDNVASRRAAEKAGYTVIEEDETKVVMSQ